MNGVRQFLRHPWNALAHRWRTVAAIVERELRVAARRPATHRVRTLAALALLGVLTWQFFSLAARNAPSAEQGRTLFVTVAVLAFLYSFFSGVRATSDCLSEEKREGTLGLLFLTDLRGIDVVLGKLASTSIHTCYGLLAMLPVLAIPVMLGGVTVAQAGWMALVLVNTMFFSLATGLLVSALSRNERKSATATVLGLFLPVVLPLVLVFVASLVFAGVRDLLDLERLLRFAIERRELNPLAEAVLRAGLWLEVANPIYALVSVLWGHTATLPGVPRWTSDTHLLVSLAATHLMGWMALALAALIVPQVWKDRAAPRRIMDWRQAWNRFIQGDAVERAVLRKRLLETNPYLWLMSRDRLKASYGWIFLFAMCLIWGWRFLTEPDVMFDFYPLLPTLVIIHTFLKVWVIGECSHRLVEDQRSGALELLLSTPLGARQIVEGQFLALARQFAGPLLALCVVEVALFGGRWSPAALLFLQTMLVADMLTLLWVSMWCSLNARNLNRVFLAGIGLVLAGPWVLYMTLNGVLEMFPFPRGFAGRENRWLSLGLALLPWLAVWSLLRGRDPRPLRRLALALALALPWCGYAATFFWDTDGFRLANAQRAIPVEFRAWLWLVTGMGCNLLLLAWVQPRVLQRFRQQVLRRFDTTEHSVGSGPEPPDSPAAVIRSRTASA